mmetsp:Transcript_76013/g.127785  ORF Transcript_76013/g.127785 Transcript_76013/m.127785 type:complete len:203 (-) Transcript_76013:939-1547(-)
MPSAKHSAVGIRAADRRGLPSTLHRTTDVCPALSGTAATGSGTPVAVDHTACSPVTCTVSLCAAATRAGGGSCRTCSGRVRHCVPQRRVPTHDRDGVRCRVADKETVTQPPPAVADRRLETSRRPLAGARGGLEGGPPGSCCTRVLTNVERCCVGFGCAARQTSAVCSGRAPADAHTPSSISDPLFPVPARPQRASSHRSAN